MLKSASKHAIASKVKFHSQKYISNFPIRNYTSFLFFALNHFVNLIKDKKNK